MFELLVIIKGGKFYLDFIILVSKVFKCVDGYVYVCF